jgi:hypothetical protein
MTDYFGAAAPYGRNLTIASAEYPAGRAARGFISPLDGTDTENLQKYTHPGKMNKEKYLFITGPSAIAEGETRLTVTTDGKYYEVLRAEPVYAAGGIGHWEGVMRLKGGASDA